MNHCPCERCKNSIDGIPCRLNVEPECREGGGFEAWEPVEMIGEESKLCTMQKIGVLLTIAFCAIGIPYAILGWLQYWFG